MAGAPDGVVVEVEFVSGTWTDVSAWVDWSASCTTNFGRSSVFSAVNPSTMTFTLDNTDGRFTPGRQTLVDGTAHPYWPNVLPRRRVRRRLVVGSNNYVRFLGYVKGWPPGFKGTRLPRVTVTAEDRLTRLARVRMQSAIRGEVLADAPSSYWPFTDDGSTSSAVDVAGSQAAFIEVATNPAVQWSQAPGPSPDDGNVMSMSNAVNGGFLAPPNALTLSRPGPGSVEFWFKARKPAPNTIQQLLLLFDSISGSTGYTGLGCQLATSGAFQLIDIAAGSALVTGPNFIDSLWHHVALVWAGASSAVKLYFDGVLYQSLASTPAAMSAIKSIWVGSFLQGSFAHLAVYPSALSTARLSAHVKMGNLVGELVSDRIARYLGYAGVPAADQSISASTVPCTTSPQGDQFVSKACQDLSTETEGPGSFFYVNPAGLIRFASRAMDVPTAPLMILDAAGDLQGDDYSPTFGDDELINAATGVRATAVAQTASFTASDPVSIAAYDLFTGDDFTSYARDTSDVQYQAQDRVSRYSQPSFRLDQVTVDLRTAQTAGLYDKLGALTLGARIRVTGLYATSAPASMVDLIVQGGSEVISDVAYLLTLLTSAADAPPPAIADDATYGRAQASGMTLAAAITAAATSLTVATAAGSPTFSTTAGDYPLTVSVGAEQITLTGPPNQAASPQTFAGVARGVNGTTASTQPSGSSLDLAPMSTAAL